MIDTFTVSAEYESLPRIVAVANLGINMCANDPSQRAARLARAAFPDSLPYTERNFGRNGFIIRNRFKLFDANRDGRLSFDEFLAGEWAGYLTAVSDGACVVTEADYMSRFLGNKGEKISGWIVPGQEKIFREKYRYIDRNNRGYITKNDIIPEVRAAFMYADRGKKGYIIPEDLK